MSELASPIILIVDDDNTSRLSQQRLLEKQGYRVAIASSGQEGLTLARALEPDLILTDVVMPDMDGYELCRRIRADEGLSDLPVVMLTSLEDSASRLKGVDAGADDFLSKPVEPELLKARVNTITRLNRYRRIQAQRSRLRWIVENASEGYVLVDHLGLISFANGKAKQLLSLPQEVQDFALYPHLLKDFNLLPQEAWAKWPELSEDCQLELLRPETTQLPACWLEVKALPNSAGGVTETLLRIADTTAQKNTQQSVWTFESLISHKLRTPLTKISWGVEFIRKKAEKLSTEQIVDFADQAHGGVQELRADLEEILAYINAPTAVPSGQGLDLNTLTETVENAACQLELSRVRLEPWSVLPNSVFLSKPSFDLICFELLQNSKKFHPEKNPEVTVNVLFENNQVCISFTDDGPGLSPDQLLKATQPYYQVEKGFTGQVPGMGLGLSMVSTMIRKVGGRLRLRNRSDKVGLVVELRIPVAPRNE